MVLIYLPMKQPRKPIHEFFVKEFKKSEYCSSKSTGKEKLIDLPNKLQDGFVIERYS